MLAHVLVAGLKAWLMTFALVTIVTQRIETGTYVARYVALTWMCFLMGILLIITFTGLPKAEVVVLRRQDFENPGDGTYNSNMIKIIA